MSKEAKEYIRYNEKINSSLCTNWTKEMIIESHEVYHQSQLSKIKEKINKNMLEDMFQVENEILSNPEKHGLEEIQAAKNQILGAARLLKFLKKQFN